MIVSHRHRYLFIEIPLTGSWAIHRELREHYGGSPILHKHASYPEYRRTLSAGRLTSRSAGISNSGPTTKQHSLTLSP